MNYFRVERSSYLNSDYNGYDCYDGSARVIYCEVCDCAVPTSEAAPDGLCFDCYTDRLIDEIGDRNLRDYISHNRSDFMDFLRGADYDC